MSHTSLYYHFVFRTKNSELTLNPLYKDEFFKYVIGVCHRRNCVAEQFNCMPDHVHMAISLHPDISVSEFIRDLKRSTSLWIKENSTWFPNFTGWAVGYFCSTFSKRDLKKVENYIKNQETHHLGKTFVEEMEDFFQTIQDETGEYFFRD